MASKSNIEWTEQTWNPIAGCSIVSPGCTNCYAMRMAARLEAMGQKTYRGVTKKSKAGAIWTGEVRQAPESKLLAPLKRRVPTTYFVNSMSDLFHESIPDEWIDRVFAVMALCPQHTFQVLTKRAERMREYCSKFISNGEPDWITEVACDIAWKVKRGHQGNCGLVERPLPNVWLGVSAERQQEADERIPYLLQTPAAVRFISAEPLLGPIDLSMIKWPSDGLGTWLDVINTKWPERFPLGRGLDWIIVGGESGPSAREHDLQWSRDLIAQCRAAGVAVFEKQLGSAPFSVKDRITYRGCKRDDQPDGFSRYLNHGKGGDWSEWPEDLRIREMPEVHHA